MGSSSRNGAHIPPAMYEVRLQFLDRAGTAQDQHAGRKRKGLSLPRKRMRRDRAMENGGIRITVVGVVAILSVVLFVILFIRFLHGQTAQGRWQPQDT